jgi:NAD(P)-dependent dehydrogenase (short-subunit alcohol dehydrogenase family)
MVGELHGKVALVTGAGTGIGRATALALAEAGANVLVHYNKSQEDANIVAKLVMDLGLQATTLHADFSDRASVAKLVEAAENHWGHVDVLVNNAAWIETAVDAKTDPSADFGTHAAHFDKALDVNLRAPWELTWRLARGMRQRGSGHIVNVASIAGMYALTDAPLYSLTKAALLHFTRQAALMYAPHVRVNAVAPGWTETGFNQGAILDPNFQKQIVRHIPAKRLASPEEIAEAILFLVKGPSYMTGTTLTIDGGVVTELR